MKSLNEIDIELRQLSPAVASLPRKVPFRLPENYFFELPSVILEKIPYEIPAKTEIPFEVPDSYFAGFPQQVMTAIRNAEADDELPTVLQSISREMPYSVPEGYFSQDRFKAPPAEVSKPVLMRPVHSFRRYAVAASVTALLAVSAWLVFPKTGASSDPALSYQEAKSLNIGAALSVVDEGVLEAYVKETPKNFAVAFLQTDEQLNVEETVAEVNTGDLDDFLIESPL